jgi:hypothetical protein
MYRSFALVLSLTLFSATASAADETASSGGAAVAVEATSPSRPLHLSVVADVPTARPRVLSVLYASYIALQGYDAYSTTAGLARGAQEANPLMQGVAQNKAAFWAMKAGTTAASIWVAESLWKKNRVGAIVTMVAVNGVMASVAARNASVLKTLR